MEKSRHHSQDFALRPFAAAGRARKEKRNIAVHNGGYVSEQIRASSESRFRSNARIEIDRHRSPSQALGPSRGTARKARVFLQWIQVPPVCLSGSIHCACVLSGWHPSESTLY